MTTVEKFLSPVKNALGITGNYQDETIRGYIEETVGYLEGAGVQASCIPPGIVARGVSDLWEYGAGEAHFSAYFMQRAAQLSYEQPQKSQEEDTSSKEDTISQEDIRWLKEAIAEIYEAVVMKQEDDVDQSGYNGTVKRMSEDIENMKASLEDIYTAVVTKQE
ncbi:MAG: hypothetical protein NC548_26875 [Lachnospiraceae bacterium]|nr:hypothetical protein [Lachnospiraceae bacterium]